jgi:RNA polymerase sigma factor (sigma-70 family)
MTTTATVGPDDAEIVRRCPAGDQAAWSLLVDRYNRYVYAICIQAFRLSRQDAEDVFQEAFARVFQHLDRLKDPGALRPWIGQVTRRLCLDRLRAASGREVPTDDLDPLIEPDAEMERLADALAVHQAMAALPEHCQEVLDRFFCRDQTYHEIGAALDIPAGTIASRISRCLSRLKEIFVGEGAQ